MNGTTTDYYWLNGILQGQKTGNEYIIFLYDENGTAYGMILKNGTTEAYYYYLFNAQGDVISIVDSTGAQVVSYEYGAWGDITAITGTLASTIGEKNPIRYRGYYYDNETGFYYLQSRYYDAEIGRFINADSQLNTDSILGNNMFAYCDNNPIMLTDPDGHIPFLAVTAALGAMVGAVIGGVKAAKSGKSVLKGALTGAAIGGLIGLGAGAAAGALLTGSVTASTTAVISGGAAFISTVGAGGLGAGATYLVDNFSRAVNGTGTALYSGGEQALKAARASGGKVINDSIGKAAEIITQDMPWEQAKPIWEKFSAQFCRQASGVVNAYICNSAYHGVESVFWSVEMPTLLSNPKVTEIIIHIF